MSDIMFQQQGTNAASDYQSNGFSEIVMPSDMTWNQINDGLSNNSFLSEQTDITLRDSQPPINPIPVGDSIFPWFAMIFVFVILVRTMKLREKKA